MYNKLISIIIPVYNTEQYIETCLDSIERQTYKNFEVIMIDDGSTDGVALRCKSYCNRDSRFKYYHKENEGVSIARNMGLKLAQGEIIGFIDSDDSISKDMIKKMIYKMEEEDADIVICDACNIQINKKECIDTINSIKRNVNLTNEQISPKILSEMAGAVWRCIYKRELLDDLFFPQGLKLSEDCVFNICAIGKAKRIYYLKEPLYYRLCRLESAVYSYHEDRFLIYLGAYKNECECIKRFWGRSYLQIYKDKFIYNCLSAIDEICSLRNKKGFKYKYEKIKYISQNEEVEKSICFVKGDKCLSNIKIKMLNRKKVMGLLILSTMANFIKNR